MAVAKLDENSRPSLIAVSNIDASTIVPLYADPVTHRLLVDLAAGAGTVTTVSVVTANGFAGSVANPTTTPAITLTTTITGILKGNGTAISAASAGTDYVAPGAITTSGLTMSTAKMLGRATGGTGAIEEIAVTGSGSAVLATSPTFATSINGDYLTISQILITDGSKNIISANTATYPSLTELSYVKGVTSAIQTQINSKGAGTVTAVSIASANGFAGSSSGGATPALTISTSINSPILSGNGTAIAAATTTGSGSTAVLNNGPTLIAPILGTPASGTLTSCTGLPAASVVAGTFGTGSYTIDTRLTVPQIINTANTVTVSSNAGTVPITSKINNFTNSSASAMTITMAVASAVDGQMSIVRIYDASAATKGITWVNTEDSTVAAPTTSNGSTTLPLTVGFQFNGATSKWRTLASA